MSTQLDEKGVSRLDFLKAGGALVIAFSLPVPLKPGSAEAAAAQRGTFAPVNPGQLDAWLAVGTPISWPCTTSASRRSRRFS